MKLKNPFHAKAQIRNENRLSRAKGERMKEKVILFILLVLNILPLAAQNDSLFQYLELAAKNSPLLKQKLLEYEAALQKVPQAGSLQDPELSLGVFLKPMELVGGRQVADATLMQMFPWFGVLRNAKDEMSLMANAKFEEFRDTKLQLFYDVQRTWYEIFKLRKKEKISRKNLDILKSIESLALIRYRTAPSGSTGAVRQSTSPSAGSATGSGGAPSQGMTVMSGNQPGASSSSQQSSMQGGASMGSSGNGTSLSDLYRIKIEISDLENNIAFLNDQERSVIAAFNGLLNRPPVSAVFSSDSLVTDTLRLSVSEIADSIRSRNPMLSMIEYEKQSYEARKKMVKGMGYPMLGLGLNYSFVSKSEASMAPDMNGKDMIMPMVRMTLPIYRKKYRAMQKEAELLSRSTVESYAATGNSLQTVYYEALQMYENSKRKIALYGEQYQLASKSLELVLKSYSATGSDLTDVLRVRQQALDYELSMNEAEADMNTAIAWIKRLMASSI